MIHNNASERKGFLDILRVIATCAVVLLHTVTGVMDATDMSAYPQEKTVFLVVMDFVTWCVPIFVLISGYLFLNPSRRFSFRQILQKYCRRIILALLLFGIPYACMELVVMEHSFHPAMIGRSLLMVLQGKSWSHMWYLYLILFLYLITPTMKKFLAVLPRPCLYVILLILYLGSSVFPFLNKLLNTYAIPVLPDGGIYLFYYMSGFSFACEQVRKPNKAQSNTFEWVVPVLCAVLLGGMLLSRTVGEFSIQMAYNYPFTVLFALLLFKLAKDMQWKLKEKTVRTWRALSTICFAIYLIHPVFVNIYYKFLHMTPLDFSIGISLPVFFAAVLLPAALAAWILCKIPVLRKYIL